MKAYAPPKLTISQLPPLDLSDGKEIIIAKGLATLVGQMAEINAHVVTGTGKKVRQHFWQKKLAEIKHWVDIFLLDRISWFEVGLVGDDSLLTPVIMTSIRILSNMLRAIVNDGHTAQDLLFQAIGTNEEVSRCNGCQSLQLSMHMVDGLCYSCVSHVSYGGECSICQGNGHLCENCQLQLAKG